MSYELTFSAFPIGHGDGRRGTLKDVKMRLFLCQKRSVPWSVKVVPAINNLDTKLQVNDDGDNDMLPRDASQ